MRLFVNGLGGTVIAEDFQDVFDASEFQYSIDYDTGKRATGSVYKFTYSGTIMTLKANPTLRGTFPQWADLLIYVNGAFQEEINVINATTEYEVTFSDGTKTIEIVEALVAEPPTLTGVWLTYLYLDANRFSILSEGSLSEKIVFLGDSIGVGANATAPSNQGYAALFRYISDRNVTILGYGSGKLKTFAETTPLVNTTVGWFTDQFTNVTTKKVVITLGTNDFALDATSDATFTTWYENLVDAINTADNTIEIFCISPIIRSSDGTLLDDYRSSIGTLCSTRSFCTHIVGKTILTTGDLDDNVHPTTAGHLKMFNAIKTTI